jgi:hypothetical protein
MNESPEFLELLSSRVDELEMRVHALEHPDEATALAVKQVVPPPSVATCDGEASLQTASIFPVLGRAMIGIAGAYVLRAVAELSVMPKVIVAAVAIAYAFSWLIWAARVSKAAGIAPFVYAGTSAVILVPMLWEETLYFHVFASPIAAGVLAGFVGLASALVWRRESSLVLSLSYGVAAGTAVALSLATHAMLPFVLLLLLIVLLSEAGKMLGHTRPVWPLVALVADAAIWGMIFIYSGPPSARSEYPELGVTALVFPACLLFVIDATSVGVRAILEGKKIHIFEIVQVMISFGLAISVVLLFASGVGTLLGIACLVFSAATYFAYFRLLRSHAEMRNLATFSLWSAVLLVGGALWSLPYVGAGMLIAVAGLAAYALSPRIGSTMLEWHGAAFLGAATAIAGVAQYTYRALASSLPGRPEMGVWIVASVAVTAYAVDTDANDDEWVHPFLRLVPALVAVGAVSAMLVYGVLAFAALAVPLDPQHIAFLRTLVISAMSLGLAFAGPRLGRIAMTRMAYVALAFVAAKLLFEDLRHGHMEFTAGSIFLFAITLIAVPRLVRMGTKSRAEAHARTPLRMGI